jgi:hypothetical protein
MTKMKRANKDGKISLGELIYELFEETSKVTKKSAEQKVLVSLALKDLLEHEVNAEHKILFNF